MDIKKKAYQKYQLDWMIRHGYSIEDLVNAMDLVHQENEDEPPVESPATPDYNAGGDFDGAILMTYCDFEEIGFDGDIWVCFDEFLDVEYRDRAYMQALLTEEEYQEYLADVTPKQQTQLKRLTTREAYPHGAEGVSEDKLTGNYCRGIFECTACIERLAQYENDEEDGVLVRNPQNGWIPISGGQYPKDHERVQITYMGYYDEKPYCGKQAYRCDGKWYWDNEDPVSVRVTAWKPKDQPYNG